VLEVVQQSVWHGIQVGGEEYRRARHPQRRMLVVYAAIFTLGSVMSATAFTPGLFIAGHVIQGLFTSMMLIAAAPPLVLGWPAKRLPTTAMVMNLGIFGAVAAGPVIGGVQASAGGWRPLFWIVCGIGGLALLLSLLTFEDSPAQEPEAPRDWTAILLALPIISRPCDADCTTLPIFPTTQQSPVSTTRDRVAHKRPEPPQSRRFLERRSLTRQECQRGRMLPRTRCAN